MEFASKTTGLEEFAVIYFGPDLVETGAPSPTAGVKCKWQALCSLIVLAEAKKSCQTACKPGSVPIQNRWGMTIPLGRSLPSASRDRPGRRRESAPGLLKARRPYLVLLPVGFAMPPPLPAARCALTAPFHPCRPPKRARRFAFCGTVPGVTPAGR